MNRKKYKNEGRRKKIIKFNKLCNINMRSQVSNQTIVQSTNSPQVPVRTRRRAQSVAVGSSSQSFEVAPQQQRRASVFESNVSF